MGLRYGTGQVIENQTTEIGSVIISDFIVILFSDWSDDVKTIKRLVVGVLSQYFPHVSYFSLYYNDDRKQHGPLPPSLPPRWWLPSLYSKQYDLDRGHHLSHDIISFFVRLFCIRRQYE